MNVTVHVNLDDAYRDFEITPAKQLRLNQAAITAMRPMVPVRTGKLTTGVYSEGDEVVYSRGVDYAVYAYHHNVTGVNEWAEVYDQRGAPEVVRELERMINGN